MRSWPLPCWFSKPFRFTSLLLFVLTALFLSVSAHAKKEKPLSTVADLRYGVTLFNYFQGDHFAALSELMVAKERGGIQGHKDNPELIEGSINLAFGMDRRAGTMFSRLLNDNRPVAVRNAAWFYLSKIRYQRGEYEQVKESLGKIVEPIAPELVDEIAAMEIQLLMREKKFDEVQQRLAAGKGGKQFQYWEPYLNFNLGSLYARLEKIDEAQGYFSKVANQRLSDNTGFHKEQLALYDKAFTASGFGYFQEKDYKAAVNKFVQVRQNSPMANDALLGYGWAKARQGDYRAALAPWLFLAQKPRADEAVQEALIAIPYAYLQLGDTNKALNNYAAAEQVFIDELNHIDEVGTQVLNQSMVEILDLDNFGTQYSWLAPENNTLLDSPSRYLLPLFSYNRFQNSVQSMVDLHRVYRRLDAWKISLDAYSDLMDYRLSTFRRDQQPEEFRDMSSELRELQVQRNKMAAAINAASEEQNVFLFLDEERLDLLDMVQSGENNIKRLADAGEYIDEESEWIQRYRGMLLWSATMDFDDRLWKIQSQLNEIDKALASATTADDKINNLLSEAPDIAEAKNRIQNFSVRVDTLLENNNSLMASIEEDIRAQIFASLALQRQRVQFYLGEARLAVAQLYDNKYLERNKE